MLLVIRDHRELPCFWLAFFCPLVLIVVLLAFRGQWVLTAVSRLPKPVFLLPCFPPPLTSVLTGVSSHPDLSALRAVPSPAFILTAVSRLPRRLYSNCCFPPSQTSVFCYFPPPWTSVFWLLFSVSPDPCSDWCFPPPQICVF